MRKILLCLLFGLGLSAQVFADNYVNVVQKVTVKNLNLNQPVTYNELIKEFGLSKALVKPIVLECASSFAIDVKYSGKKAQIEYFAQGNPASLFKQPFKFQDDRLKGNLSLNWFSMVSLKEKVMLDDWQVHPDLTFDQFKKRFPLSAQTPEEVGEHGALTYAVVFRLSKKMNKISQEEVYLSRHVLFTFTNKKLSKLHIEQGDDC